MWPFKSKQPEPEPQPVNQVRRAFAAARIGRLWQSWVTTPTAIDHELLSDYYKLVARARWEGRNNRYFRRYLELMVCNIVGPAGIGLQAQIRRRDGTPDERRNEALEDAWRQWGRPGNCDVTGRYGWRDICCLAVRHLMREGEALIVSRRNYEPAGAGGYALQLWDPLALDLEKNVETRTGNRVALGVELNALRRPLAYHLMVDDTNPHRSQTAKRPTVRIDARRVTHLYIPDEVTQTRGFPAASAILSQLHQLDGGDEATLVSWRAAAAQMGFLVADNEDEPPVTFDEDAGDDEPLIDATEPGVIHRLPNGMHFEQFSPTAPPPQYESFHNAMLQGISAGLGVGYNSLSNDYASVNFSSLKGSALVERQMYRALQQYVVEHLVQPIFEAWFQDNARLIPGFDALSAPPPVSWSPPRWAWHEPLKEAQADELNIAQGLTSRTQILRDRGLDPDQIWRELETEHERLSFMRPVVPAPMQAQDEPDEDEETEAEVLQFYPAGRIA